MDKLTHTIETSRARLVAGLTVLVAVGLPVAGILTADARDVQVSPGVGDWIFVALVAVVAVATFGLLLPWSLRGQDRQTRVVKSGLTLSIIAFVLSFMFFWTMIPVIFGSAGAWLGYQERERAKGTGQPRRAATAVVVIGAIAAIASVAGTVATS